MNGHLKHLHTHIKTHTPYIPPGVWTESISLGKQECAFIKLQSCFISPSAFEPQHRPGAVIPFHLSSCMFNPLLSIPPSLLAHLPLSPLFLYCSYFPPTSLQTSSLPASSLHRSIPLNTHPVSLPPSLFLHQSTHPSLFLLLLLLNHKPSTGWTLSSLYLLLPLPADGMFAQRLGRAL